MSRRLALVASLLFALALVAPAVSSAALFNFGSNLSEKASVAFPHSSDTAFWSTALSGGARAKAPHAGQIYAVRVRGCAERGSGGQLPLTQVHFQVLVPGAGAKTTIAVTSGPENMPVCGGHVTSGTISTFHPVNMCVHAGNYVAFNDEGGFNPTGFPDGVSYEVLAPAPGASTASFTGTTDNGSVLTSSPHAGDELLMQLVLATGKNAVGVCR